MKTFSHSGDLGDVIYSLPTIRACGGGNLILFDYPGRTAHGMSAAKVARIKPLLECQDYIGTVLWSESFIDHDLNGFRDHLGKTGNLTDAHLSTHGFDWNQRIERWIEVEPRTEKNVIFSRSARYRNQNFDWASIVEEYRDEAGFVGFKDEHQEFCKLFGDVPLVDAPDFLELAKVIAGARLFVGNQSSPLAVAHGLKQNVIMEVSTENWGAREHCIFQRMNCIIGWDRKIELPSLKTLPVWSKS